VSTSTDTTTACLACGFRHALAESATTILNPDYLFKAEEVAQRVKSRNSKWPFEQTRQHKKDALPSIHRGGGVLFYWPCVAGWLLRQPKVTRKRTATTKRRRALAHKTARR
jgi:hypothetical protein